MGALTPRLCQSSGHNPCTLAAPLSPPAYKPSFPLPEKPVPLPTMLHEFLFTPFADPTTEQLYD